jgi:hypothetical protein
VLLPHRRGFVLHRGRLQLASCSRKAEPQTTKPAEAGLVWKQRHSVRDVTTTSRTKPGQCDPDQGKSVGGECLSSGQLHSGASRNPELCSNRLEASQPFPWHFPERIKLRKCKGPLNGGPSFCLVERRSAGIELHDISSGVMSGLFS